MATNGYYGLRSTRTGGVHRGGPAKGEAYRLPEPNLERYLEILLSRGLADHAIAINELLEQRRKRLFEDFGRASGKVLFVVRGPDATDARRAREIARFTSAGTPRKRPLSTAELEARVKETPWTWHVRIGRRDKWGRGLELGIDPHPMSVPGGDYTVNKGAAPLARKWRRLQIQPRKSLKGYRWQPWVAKQDPTRGYQPFHRITFLHPGVEPGRYDIVKRNLLELDRQLQDHFMRNRLIGEGYSRPVGNYHPLLPVDRAPTTSRRLARSPGAVDARTRSRTPMRPPTLRPEF